MQREDATGTSSCFFHYFMEFPYLHGLGSANQLIEENLLLFRLRLQNSDEHYQVPLSGNKHVHHVSAPVNFCADLGAFWLNG